MSYTVGQVVYNIDRGNEGTVTKGVQQPYDISVISNIDDQFGASADLFVYPNPTCNF
jgi:hypothetical protein